MLLRYYGPWSAEVQNETGEPAGVMQTWNNVTIFGVFAASLVFCAVYWRRSWWQHDARSGYLGRAIMLTRALTAAFMGLLTARRLAGAPVTALWFLTCESTVAALWALAMGWHTVILIKLGKRNPQVTPSTGWSVGESNPSPR